MKNRWRENLKRVVLDPKFQFPGTWLIQLFTYKESYHIIFPCSEASKFPVWLENVWGGSTGLKMPTNGHSFIKEAKSRYPFLACGLDLVTYF